VDGVRACTAHAKILIVLLPIAGLAGCAGLETTELPRLRLTIRDGARWMEPQEVERYWCAEGLLVCTGGAGRMTSRLCRCVDDGVSDPVEP